MRQQARNHRQSGVLLYVQLATTLRRRIETGEWAPGDKISTLEELQAEFGVARVTVRQAIEMLQNEGLVECHQGKGTFVSEELRDRRWLQLETSWSSLVDTIKDNVPKFIPVKNPPAGPRLGAHEGRPAEDYVFLRSVQSRNGEAYSVVSVHLAREVFDRDPRSFRTRTALATIAGMKDLQVAAAHQTLVIGSADTLTAQLLRVPINAPTAEAHCVVRDARGVAIYIGDIVYRGDCIKLDIKLL